MEEDVADRASKNEKLLKAYWVIDNVPDIEKVVAQIRDILEVDHLVYHSSKLGTSPSVDPFIRLTYPDAWIKRYLQMGYVDVDPVVREGFSRILPFDWSELTIGNVNEASFLMDALANGVGPHGLSIPVRSKRGHRALLSVSFSRSEPEWREFLKNVKDDLVLIANRLHSRVIIEVFNEERPHLTARELACLGWIAKGKSTCEIAIILNISPHTTRDYLKSSRHKLNAVTSAQAVSNAVKLGLLVV